MVCLMPACKSYITIPIGWKKNEILAAYTAQASEDLQPNVGQFLIVFMQNLIDPASAILGSAMAGAAIACYKLLSVVICEFFSHSNVLISKQANMSKLAIFALNQNQTGTEIWRTAVINKAGYIPRSCGINHVVDSPYSLNSFPINLRSNVKQVTAVTT